MKGRDLHAEWWISQGEEWMPNSKTSVDPMEVLYDPVYWNGAGFWTSYNVEFLKSNGNPSEPYWLTFLIIDTELNEVIARKDFSFQLKADERSEERIIDDSDIINTPQKPDEYSALYFSYFLPFFSGIGYDWLMAHFPDPEETITWGVEMRYHDVSDFIYYSVSFFAADGEAFALTEDTALDCIGITIGVGVTFQGRM